MIERRTVVTDPHGCWHFIPEGEVTITDSETGGYYARVGAVSVSLIDALSLAADEGRVVLVPDVGRFLVCRENPFTGDAA